MRWPADRDREFTEFVMVQRAALTQSLNEGWLALAGLFLLALLLVPMIRRSDV